MKEKFNELEYYLLNESAHLKVGDITSGWARYSVEEDVKGFLTNILGKDIDYNNTPVSVSNERPASIGDIEKTTYHVKTKGSSTILFDIEVETKRVSGNYWQNEVISVEAYRTSKIWYDINSLISYLENRLNINEQKAVKKEQPFRDELTQANIDVAEFIKLQRIFERLDAPIRRRLIKEANNILNP